MKKTIPLLAILILAIYSCKAPESVMLQTRHNPGGHFFTTEKIWIDVSIPLILPRDSKTYTVIEYRSTVDSVDALGNFHLSCLVTSPKKDSSNHDSSLKPDNTLTITDVNKYEADKKFHMVVSPQGASLEVVGLSEICEDARKHIDKDQPSPDTDNELSDQSTRTEMLKYSFIYPDCALQIGDKWSKSIDLSAFLQLPVRATYDYTLTGRKDGQSIIDFVAAFDTKKLFDALNNQEDSNQFSVDLSGSGTIVVDEKSGQLRKMNYDQSMEMIMDQTADKSISMNIMYEIVRSAVMTGK